MHRNKSPHLPCPTGDAGLETAEAKQLQALLSLRPHVRIAHHMPGRLRIRFEAASKAIIKQAGDDAMACFRTMFPGVRDAQVNPIARSVLISYDPARIPPSLWEAFLTAPTSADAAAVLGALA